MSVAVQQNIPLGKRRRAGRVVMVAVGGKHCAGTGIQQGIVGQNREVQHHLVHLGIAVAAHAQQPLPQGIQHGNYLFGGIALRQVVAGTVVQNIPQQQQLVRLLALHGGKQLPAVKSRTVQVGCNHQFHGSSSGGGLDAARRLIL